MTPEELLAKYPDCRVAVAYCELILDTRGKDDPPGEPTAFDILRRATPPASPREALEVLQDVLAGETTARAQQALAEMSHPSFMTYLRGKLGAM